MRENLTELVFILDRSGSMSGLEADTIGGFNSLIEKQKREEGEALVSTVLFDDYSDVIYDRVKISDVKKMTENEYYVRGCTALLDAIGGAIHHIGNVHKYAREEDKPAKTLFIITTDGMENASHKYEHHQIKSMISAMREERKWEFIFLGANIEAEEVAESYGILRDRSVNYHSDKRGTKAAWESIDSAVKCCMESRSCCESLGEVDWKKAIKEDRKKRQMRKYDVDDEDAA